MISWNATSKLVRIRYSACRHCDGFNYNYPYGRDETKHCISCGAEWDPVEVEDMVPEQEECFEMEFEDDEDEYEDMEDDNGRVGWEPC